MIGNQLYDLQGVPDLTDKKGDPIYGEAAYWKSLIRYDSDYAEPLIEETLIHEVLETIKHTMSNMNFSEIQMDVIARHVVQFIRQFDFSMFEDEVEDAVSSRWSKKS